MSTRATGLNRVFLTLVGAALFLGAVSGRVELVLVAAPLVIVLLLVPLTHRAFPCRINREMPITRLFEGERATVTVSVGAEGPLRHLELLEPLPSGAEVVAGSNRVAHAVEAGHPIRWSYELGWPSRGRATIGSIYLRAWHPSGLRVSEMQHRDPTPIRVYPSVTRIRRLPRPLRTQTSVGNYVSPGFGEGLEPADIRLFAPGDRVRHLNWPVSLRLGRLYVTEHHQERNADIVLMLDTLSQVGRPPVASLDLSVRAAAALASAYLARKDRVGLIQYGGVIQWVKPGSGRAHLERLLDTLLDAHPIFTYVAKDLAVVPRRVLSPRALVVALSPLLDARFTKAVIDLAGRGFELVVLSVSPIELTRSAVPASPVRDAACRLWALERRAQLADLRARGLRVIDWRPDQPVELALTGLVRAPRRAVMAP
jgi:uncharacterized protein (DUF58 family)